MSALWQAAGLLAAATVIAPPPPRHRLRPVRVRAPRPTAAQLRVLFAALAVAALVATATGFITGPPLVSAALAGVTVWARYRRRRARRLRRAQGRAMAQAMEILVGEVKAGATPVRAVAAAAVETSGPIGSALRAIGARALLGADVAEGMRQLAEASVVGRYWHRLAVCWQLAAVHGLPMSALMSAAQRDITERERFTDRMDAALAGPRATAAILAGLPVVGGVLGELIGAHPVRFLFASPQGGWLLMIGTALLCAGIGWTDRIIDGSGR